ncbi:hypothetical protein GCM10023237_69990 [Streptomyces coeruleoprunus]
MKKPQNSPEGSLKVMGLLLAYAYGFIVCDSATSIFGSTEMNRPSAGRTRVREVGESGDSSIVPPTKPFSLGHMDGFSPRASPNGVNMRRLTAPVVASTAVVAVAVVVRQEGTTS